MNDVQRELFVVANTKEQAISISKRHADEWVNGQKNLDLEASYEESPPVLVAKMNDEGASSIFPNEEAIGAVHYDVSRTVRQDRYDDMLIKIENAQPDNVEVSDEWKKVRQNERESIYLSNFSDEYSRWHQDNPMQSLAQEAVNILQNTDALSNMISKKLSKLQDLLPDDVQEKIQNEMSDLLTELLNSIINPDAVPVAESEEFKRRWRSEAYEPPALPTALQKDNLAWQEIIDYAIQYPDDNINMVLQQMVERRLLPQSFMLPADINEQLINFKGVQSNEQSSKLMDAFLNNNEQLLNCFLENANQKALQEFKNDLVSLHSLSNKLYFNAENINADDIKKINELFPEPVENYDEEHPLSISSRIQNLIPKLADEILKKINTEQLSKSNDELSKAVEKSGNTPNNAALSKNDRKALTKIANKYKNPDSYSPSLPGALNQFLSFVHRRSTASNDESDKTKKPGGRR